MFIELRYQQLNIVIIIITVEIQISITFCGYTNLFLCIYYILGYIFKQYYRVYSSTASENELTPCQFIRAELFLMCLNGNLELLSGICYFQKPVGKICPVQTILRHNVLRQGH